MLNNKTNFKVKTIFISCLASSIMLMSCGNSGKTAEGDATATDATAAATDTHYTAADLVDLDLSSSGIPVIAKAPKDAKVMKYGVNGDICVYGGKFFKLTFAAMDGVAADAFSDIKAMTSDKELNTSFDKFEAEDGDSFLKVNKKGEYAFIRTIDAGGKAITISEGMPYDISPDQFSDYPADDVKVMYEAAKAAKAK